MFEMRVVSETEAVLCALFNLNSAAASENQWDLKMADDVSTSVTQI